MRGSDFNNFFDPALLAMAILSLIGSLSIIGVSIWAVVKLVSWITT